MTRAPGQAIAIFGASGDLASRKLMPSLFGLYARGLMPENFAVVGAARSDFSDESFRKFHRENIKNFLRREGLPQAGLGDFLSRLFYARLADYGENSCEPLAKKILSARKKFGVPDNILFDLATPANVYCPAARALQNAGLCAPPKGGFRRIIVEKPFGFDLESSRQIDGALLSIFPENEIFRIDHFLGKETVQNILVLRFANEIFESVWNRDHVSSVEIYASETAGVERRGGYYEHAGALRDMVQNHLLHLMAFVAMEAPASFDSESLRDETAKVLRALKPLSPPEIAANAIRAQYAASEGRAAYREEEGVAKNSCVETYAAVKAHIENWRWAGVPFYLITGKAMPEKKSEIVIRFKSAPLQFFGGQCKNCNSISIRIQPDEGVGVLFGLKIPGAGFEVRQVCMDFKYASLSKKRLPDAYERLLLDAMCGDASLYARADFQRHCWKFVEPILNCWRERGEDGLLFYKAGSCPPAFGELLPHSLCRIPPVRAQLDA